MASILKVDTLQKPDGSTPTAADLGIDVSGSVVQVKQFTLGGGAMNTTSTSYVATGLGGSFTPKYANSKIYLFAINQASSESAGAGCGFSFYKNGSGLFYPSSTGTTNGANSPHQMYGGVGNNWTPVVLDYLDTAGTTDPIQYDVYVAGYTAAANPYKGNAGIATLTIYEIAQ